MTALKGTYYNGRLTLEAEYPNDKPVEVIVTFLEDQTQSSGKRLFMSDFSFSKTRALLQHMNEEISPEVIAERRSEL